MTVTARKVPGVIESSAAYELREFARRCKFGEWALREARKAGLPVRTIGRRQFVIGSEFIAFLQKQET